MHFLKAFLLEVNEFWFNHFWRKLTFWKGWDFQSELFCMKENLVVSILFFEPLFFHLHTFACAKNGILDRINELRLESGKYSVWKYCLARCMRLILILYWNQGRFVDSGIFVFKHIFDRGFWFIYFKSTIILHNFTLISMKLFFQAEKILLADLINFEENCKMQTNPRDLQLLLYLKYLFHVEKEKKSYYFCKRKIISRWRKKCLKFKGKKYQRSPKLIYLSLQLHHFKTRVLQLGLIFDLH